MSASDYLRTRLAAQQRVTSTRKPTDSSEYTHKIRLSSSSRFFADGTSVGTLRRNADDSILVGNSHPSLAFKKASTGRTPLASEYTSFYGSTASSLDIAAQNTGVRKSLICIDPKNQPSIPDWQYRTGSDFVRNIKCIDTEKGVQDLHRDTVFVDNTIRLSAMLPSKVDGCSINNVEDARHNHKPGIQIDVDNQRYAVGKDFFMANPPNPQGTNVSGNRKRGGYLGNRAPYVERKQGFVKPTEPIPQAPGPQGQDIEQLRINSPTFVPKT
jgi:hypothetical protein